jgi:Uma2 family endonuclease
VPTKTADGLPRWRWTIAEIERMATEGYFRDDERIELLGGEIVPMSPKGRRHEIIRIELTNRFIRMVPADVTVAPEAQFNLSSDTYTVPDLLACAASIRVPDLRGPDALLVIEIADTSLSYDLTTKAALYASHGVREYWVINAVTLVTKVHRQPSGDRYTSTEEIAASDPLTASLVPSLSLSLDTVAVD